METQANNGITALLAAADEVQAVMGAPPPADRVCETVQLKDMLREMSETLHTQLSTIHSRMNTLAERVDTVEKGPRPNTTPHTSRTPGSESLDHISDGSSLMAPEDPLSWANRDPNERLAIDQDEILVWPEDDPELTEDTEQGCQLHRVSSVTESLLKETYAKTVPNGTRRRWR